MRVVTAKPLTGTIAAIPAKAHAHRAFMAAALGDEVSTFRCSRLSKDMEATLDSLEALGAKVSRQDAQIRIEPIDGVQELGAIRPNESGTTLRLLLPIAAAIVKKTTVEAKGRLPERPLEPLLSQMKAHGVDFSEDKPPFIMKGLLQGGDFHMAGNISSQFFSGLLLAAPLYGGGRITSDTNLQSKDYVTLTEQVMADFGITVEETMEDGKLTFTVSAHSHYGHVRDYVIEGDWSNSAVWCVAAAMTGYPLTITGVLADSVQADKRIVPLLVEAGAGVLWDNRQLLVTGQASKPIRVDLEQCPDLLPVLASLALAIPGESAFVNGARLRLKESDRLEAVAALVKAAGGQARLEGDNLYIRGTGQVKGGLVDCVNDHRLVMAGALLGLIAEKPMILKDSQAIAKSYPDFFDDWASIGGDSYELTVR